MREAAEELQVYNFYHAEGRIKEVYFVLQTHITNQPLLLIASLLVYIAFSICQAPQLHKCAATYNKQG